MTLETSLKKAIKDYLNLKNIFWWHNLQGIGSYPGTPDICVVHKGKFYGIEIKAPKGRLSEYQQRFKENLETSEGIFIEARSLDDVMKVL